MHDRTGKPLAKGDRVNIACVVADLYATEEYCNVRVETVYGRRPDGQKESWSAVNTGVMDKVDPLETEPSTDATPLHQTTGAAYLFGLPNVDVAGLTAYLKGKSGDELAFGRQLLALVSAASAAPQNPLAWVAVLQFVMANAGTQWAFLQGLAKFLKATPASGGTSGPAPFPGTAGA